MEYNKRVSFQTFLKSEKEEGMNSFTDLFLYLPSLYRLLFLLHYVFSDETVHLYHFGFYRLRYFSC